MFQNKNVVINENDTLHSALIKLSKISNLSKLILFVTNDNNQIIGSVTDGDVRRALIEDKNLDKKIGDICNRNFLFLKDSEKYVSLKKIKKSNPSIKILPVLNKNDQLVSSILNLVKKYKVNMSENFSILVNSGPGSFSSIRVSLTVAKGIKISKKINLYGFKNSDLGQFNLANIELLIKKNLIQKNLIKPLYIS